MSYQEHAPLTWKHLETLIENYDFDKSLMLEHGGIPPNTCVGRINNQFLLGIVNYLQNPKAFVINCYGLDADRINQLDRDVRKIVESEHPTKRYFAVDSYYGKSTQFKTCAIDDTLIYGESLNSFYVLWFDCGIDNGSIWRFSKDKLEGITLSNVITAHHAELRHQYDEVIEVKKINGWII